MSEDKSARLGLPYLAAGQLQKHVTLNEALTRLDVLVQTCVQSRSRVDQPAEPSSGDLYIVPPAATGDAWHSFQPGDLVRFEAAGWLKVTVQPGVVALILDEAALVAWIGGHWTGLGGEGPNVDLETLQQVRLLGLNTQADATNPFSARLNKALWSALGSAEGGDGDLRFTFNKEGSGDVLSLLFQSNWGGRAELGLIGDDDLTLKVSADGAAWHDVFSVDRTNGQASFARGAARRATTILTDSGSWTPPAWARWVEVVCVGGGGGGGAGHAGTAGTARYGGGGGGAGGVSTATWPVSSLSGALTVSVGRGGAGGLTSGAAGSSGTDSQVMQGSAPVLSAKGGNGGTGGQSSPSGLGGSGGLGIQPASAGGSSVLGLGNADGGSGPCGIGPGGGGAGGGISVQNAPRSGGKGGLGSPVLSPAEGGAGGWSQGTTGTSVHNALFSQGGGGGGGGGGASSGTGHQGGGGGLYGGGGGGGGGGISQGGPGGSGADGIVIITAVG